MLNSITDDTKIDDVIYSYVKKICVSTVYNSRLHEIVDKIKIENNTLTYIAGFNWNYNRYQSWFKLIITISYATDTVIMHSEAIHYITVDNITHRKKINEQHLSIDDIINTFNTLLIEFSTVKEFEADMFVLSRIHEIQNDKCLTNIIDNEKN